MTQTISDLHEIHALERDVDTTTVKGGMMMPDGAFAGRCQASRQQVSEGHSLVLEIHLSQFSHDSRTALHSFPQKPEATKEI